MKTMLVVWTSIAALIAGAPIGKAHAADQAAFDECKGKAIELYRSKSIALVEFADTLKACQILASIPDNASQPATSAPSAQSVQPITAQPVVNVTVTQTQPMPQPPAVQPQPVAVPVQPQPELVQPQRETVRAPKFAKAVCQIVGTRINYYITLDVRSKDAYVGGRVAEYTYVPHKGTYVGIDDLTIFVADGESGLSSSTTKNSGGLGLQALNCTSFG
jgi:hypothetical protein